MVVANRLVLTVAAALAVAVASCGPRTGDITPSLDPLPGAEVWPKPPDEPRYALAGVLIGEANFVDPENSGKSGARQALEWIAGVITGPIQYQELRRPVAGAIRDDGAVLVVDAGLKAVAVFDLNARQFRLWTRAGPEGAGFASPVAIAPDGRGGWLVTDADLGQVIRLDPEGEPTGSFGGGLLERPTGIAVDPATGNIYVADSARHRITVFDQAGNAQDTIGDPGRGLGRLNTPTHLWWAGDSLLVADTLNFRIQRFSRDGTPEASFGELGLQVGNFSRPKGVAMGADGRIYVVESYYDHLLVFDPTGQLLIAIGGTGSGIGQFYLPSGVWTDGNGRVFVADMFNGRVMVFSELTGLEDHG